MHASYSYPTAWLALLEVLLVLATLLLLLAAPRRLLALDRRLWRRARHWGRRPIRALLLLALTAFGINALLAWIQGPPVPEVADEHSYLLAADTFARGRMTNPAHPQAVHFESFHILVEPSYASKYPPAQGLLLAAGQALGGHPAVGLWMSSALLSLAVGWMLLAWLPARWALFGALVAALRLGVGSYWGQSYWGGAAAAVGGALLFGALPRLLRGPRVRHAFLLALGVALLANSRPLEGLLASLPAAGLLLGWLLARRPPRRAFLLRFLLPAGLALALTAGLMLRYNQQVTGEPLLMPYQLHERTYTIRPLFLWQELLPEPDYRHGAIRAFYRSYAEKVDLETPWPLQALRQGWRRLALGLGFQLGLALVLALVGLRHARRRRWIAFAVGTAALVVGVHAFTHAWWPHYDAPATALLFFLALAGLRALHAWSRGGRRAGRVLPLAILASNALLFLLQIPAHRPDPDDWSRERQRIVQDLEARPGKHLILLRHPTGSASEWVYNGADLEGAKVLWARDMGEEANRALIAHYEGRHVWRLGGELAPRPLRLEPYVAESDGAQITSVE